MFRANKESRYDDPAASYLFGLLSNHPYAPTFDAISILTDRDILEECYTYIHRDRPLLVNECIEHELLDTDEVDDLKASLKKADTHYLCRLIENRSYLYV